MSVGQLIKFLLDIHKDFCLGAISEVFPSHCNQHTSEFILQSICACDVISFPCVESIPRLSSHSWFPTVNLLFCCPLTLSSI